MADKDIVLSRAIDNLCPICGKDLYSLITDDKKDALRPMKYDGVDVLICATHEVPNEISC